MNWNLKKKFETLGKNKPEEAKPEEAKPEVKRSEEISDVIERMPMNFGRWVAWAFFVFSTFLVFFGWIIKYPDIVTGLITISSTQAPVKIVANSSGNIQEIRYGPQSEVKKGEYIAVIENPAVTEDVRMIMKRIGEFDPNKNSMEDTIDFPEKVSLGELNIKYYSFLSILKNKRDYERENVYERQRIALQDDLEGKRAILSESQQLMQIIEDKMSISQKWFHKYASLNQEEIVTYEYEVDRSKTELLLARQEEKNQKKEIATIRMQIQENENRIRQLNVEQIEKERQLRLDLLTTYQELTDNLKAWEQKYVFKAPFTGKVEYLSFLKENQFIQAGEEVFGVVPKESDVFGQMMLPSSGAGKVKVGDRVSVKLDNYPFMEYGSIEGKLSSISLLSQPQRTAQSVVNTYLLIIDLPDRLRTNYGEALEFQHEISGTADIIIKERRLIERLFDNMKYRTK